MIGKQITSIILNDTAVAAIIGNMLFPISDYFSDSDTLPAIYYKVRVSPYYVKNGPSMQDWSFTLLTMCKDYDESWELTSKLIQAFNTANRHTIEGVQLNDLRCQSATDDYEFNIDSFGQIIEFTVNTKNIKLT